MSMKKVIMKTGIIASVLLFGACAESQVRDDTEPATESEQSEDLIQDENSAADESQNEKNDDQDEDAEGSSRAEEESDEANKEEIEKLKEEIKNPSSTAVLANKKYSLPEAFIPENLVTVDVPTVLPNPEIKQMRGTAADALKDMFEAAEKEGIILYARSGYRSYDTQVQLFKNYASKHGEEAANKYSARPGESEHQTGLVMDVTSESVNLQITSDFGETEEGQWVKENAHEYGFIIRYPEGKSDITGYIYEPWHLRYLGKELASEVYESGLTYEKYLVERGLNIEIQ
ncbi:M15 family metallopeptidase [Alkalibacterium kapii]|uniref:Putative carboxypeptidase YodJ n=1 Tax=Alkalibacterium kapii TaxID=426704 RepID=A0A511AVJ8_9LACT|nr:M15 family metallopeptidase [Alkalibacterium kapii]GEK91682.1 putative carboxypeptidase YodJ [Alkalibacterium kapii]